MQTILFVCVQNAGRSQMAEAFFNAKAKARGVDAQAESAGTRGGGGLYSLTVRAMEEIGISMAEHVPKLLKPEMVERASKIVSMGREISAEGAPEKMLVTENWAVDDPVGQTFGEFRRIRDEIGVKVDELIDSLEPVAPVAKTRAKSTKAVVEVAVP